MNLDKQSDIKDILINKVGTEKANEIWSRAEEILFSLEKKYPNPPRVFNMHLSFILPSAAIQLACKEITGDEMIGYNAISVKSWAKSEKMGNFIKKMTKIPGFNHFFLWIWDPISKKMFGPKAGFKNVFYPKKKDEYRMDIVECPYHRYFTELGTPELTKIYCINDEYTYGHLPGIEFSRTTTLGTGGDKCDFCIRLKRESK